MKKLTIEIDAAQEGHVLLEVKDNGSGIDPEVLPRIFEPFFSTKALSDRRGTGMGLFMVHESAKELGYGLAVDSKTAQGSTFTILMPANVSWMVEDMSPIRSCPLVARRRIRLPTRVSV